MNSPSPIRLEDVAPEVFEAHVGSSFAVALEENQEPTFTMELKEVEILRGERPSGTKPFSLLFRSLDGLPLVQQLFWLKHGELGDFPLFLVPVSAVSDARTFQAVIN